MINLNESTYNYQPIMFYTTAGYRSDNQTEYPNQVDNPLTLVDSTRLLPFQLLKTTAITDSLTVAKLINIDTGKETDILSDIGSGVTNYSDVKGYITYDGNSVLTLDTGIFKMVCEDGTNTWTSENFCIVDISANDYIKITYRCTFDNFDFIFQDDFKFRFYINAPVHNEPDNSLEEFTTNEDNERTLIEAIDIPRYSFETLGKDWYYRMLKIMERCDEVTMTLYQDRVSQAFVIKNLDLSRSRLNVNYYTLLMKFETNKTNVYRSNQRTNITLASKIIVDENLDNIVDENNDGIVYV